jgi:hypothetical protein
MPTASILPAAEATGAPGDCDDRSETRFQPAGTRGTVAIMQVEPFTPRTMAA